MSGRKHEDLRELACRALMEDVGSGDITSELVIDSDAQVRAQILQKQPGVVFGYEIANRVFEAQDNSLRWLQLEPEGCWYNEVPVALVEISGCARSILTAERVALNFMQHLSGVATLTARYVKAVKGTGTTILDTRKTLPGLRALEKAAVVAGGGTNHRFGLDDAILIKDNHIALAGSLSKAVQLALKGAPAGMTIEVECGNLDQVSEALAAGAIHILLDNMTVDQIQQAVNAVAGKAVLEVSGGVSLDSVADVAVTAVQFISVGSLTHSAPALDLSLEII